MTPATDIEVRNLHFTFDNSVPKHWHGGVAARSAFYNSQSPLFPAGERFFVDSVKHFIPQLRDQALRREAQIFCGQEAVHTREHERYNAMLDAQGYPATRIERGVYRFLGFITRITPARWRLGVTCALEHFTAISAHFALSESAALDGADARMAAFWRWHAGEELEHKSVAFDVYHAVSGSYLERIGIMISTTLIFQVYLLVNLARFLRVDAQLWSMRAWREAFGVGRFDRQAVARMRRDYWAYYKPGFHPEQLDTQPGLAAFKSQLQTSAILNKAWQRRKDRSPQRHASSMSIPL